LTGYFGSAASNSPPPPQTLPAEKECKRVFSVTTPSKNAMQGLRGIVSLRDESAGGQGHLLFRTRTLGPDSIDCVQVVVRKRKTVAAAAAAAAPSPFDVQDAGSADQVSLVHYVHGALWPSVKHAVEYAVDVARLWQRPKPAEGWLQWLWGRGVGGSDDDRDGEVAFVTVCSFDLLAGWDVRVVVDCLKGAVAEFTVDREGKVTDRLPDVVTLMRGVAASQLIRAGRTGLRLCPVGLIPPALIRVIDLPRGAAFAFCVRHREFVASLPDERLAELLYAQMRHGAWAEVQEWLDDSFVAPEHALRLVLLSLRVYEDRPISSLSRGIHLGRVTLGKFPDHAPLVLAQCRLLLKSRSHEHCLSLLERLPSLTSDAAMLREAAVLRAATYAASGDLLGSLDVLQSMCREEDNEEPAVPEFPLGQLVACEADDTVGTEAAWLLYPKFSLLFGFDYRLSSDPMLWALACVRDQELVLQTIRGGNAEGRLHPRVWRRLELIGHVFSSCESILDKRYCLAFALAWHRTHVLRDSVYNGLVAALRHCNPAQSNVLLFSCCVYACAELALSSTRPDERETLVKDTVGAAEELGKKANNFLVSRAFALFRESEILVREEEAEEVQPKPSTNNAA
jgi:hypothetical protein